MNFARSLVAGLLVCALCPTIAVGAQPGGLNIVKTVDLNTYSEDITFIRTGPHAKHVAFIEDARVMAYALTSQGNGAVKELFDLTGRIPRDFMNGLAYMDTEKRFAIVSRQFMDKIMVFEPNGKLQSERPITYPAGYHVGFVEGIEYIPPDATRYPDHLAMCTGEGDGITEPQTGDIMVLTRDGTVVKRIPLPASTWGCGGIAYREPGQLLVTGFNDSDWGIVTVIDFNGNVLAVGSDRIDPAGEGLAMLPDGNVLAVGSGGDVLMLGPDLKRKPEGDRTFRPTQGVGSVTYGLAWNSSKLTFVLCANSLINNINYALYDLPLEFDGAVKLTDLAPRPAPPYYRQGRLTYLPSEDLIGLAQRPGNLGGIPVPLSIQLFRGSDGSHHSEVILPSELNGRGLIFGLAHIDATNEFAVTFNSIFDSSGNPIVDDRGLVHIVSRSGAFVRTIHYPAIVKSIAAVAVFPSGTEFLLTDGYTMYVGDLIGNVTAQYPLSDYNMIGSRGSIIDLALVTSGEYAGMFAAAEYNRAPYKLTIFTLDQPGKKK